MNSSFYEHLPYIYAKLGREKEAAILRKSKKETRISSGVPEDGRSGGLPVGKVFEITAKDGEISTYIIGEKYPVDCYPDIETVWVTMFYKRLIPLMANSLKKQNIFGKIITLIALRLNFKNIAVPWFEHIFETNKVLLKEEYYTKPVKEIRRVLKGMMDQQLIDALTLIIEYDAAYRYRLQDVLALVDKVNAEMNPIGELKRLFEILIDREDPGGSMKWRWKNKMIFLNYLYIDRKMRDILKKFLLEINVDEIKSSPADLYWQSYQVGYNFRGMTPQEREAERPQL